MRALVLACVLPGMALAEPSFTPRSLPGAHVYTGGWEHFVGGGVAVFDCNGDGFDDLYMAGGKNPAQLFINQTGTAGAALQFGQGVSKARLSR